MDQDNASTIVDGRQRFARKQVNELLAELATELSAARAGDLEAVHGVFLAASRAVRIVMANRLDAA